MDNWYAWTRGFYATFGIFSFLAAWQQGLWTEDALVGLFMFVLAYTVGRAILMVVMEKIDGKGNKVDGSGSQGWGAARSDAHSGAWRDSSDES